MQEEYLAIGAQLKLKGQSILKIESKKDFFSYVKDGNRKIIKEMINNGTDINLKDKDGWTALMIATDNNDSKTVDLLVELGSDINLQNDDGQTALMLATFSGYEEIGKYLILHGADLYLTDNWNQNALDIAKEKWEGKKDNYFLSNEYLEVISKEIICTFFCDFLLRQKEETSIPIADLENSFSKIFKKELTCSDIDFGIDFINNQILGKDFLLKKEDAQILIVSENHEKIIAHLKNNTTDYPKWSVELVNISQILQNENDVILLNYGKYYYEQGYYDRAELFLEESTRKNNKEAKRLLNKLYKNELKHKYDTKGPIPTNACRMTSGGNAPSGTWSKYLKY